MKVLFDHRIFTTQVYGGVSRYHYELLQRLPEEGIDVLLSLLLTNNAYVNNNVLMKRLSFFPYNEFYGKYFCMRLVNELNTFKNLYSKKFDIFHPTYFSEYILHSKILMRKPMVVTVHDLIHEKFMPENPIIPVKRKLIEHAEKIIAISENTKNDLINLLRINPEKITVIYHGNNIIPSEGLTTRLKYNQPYFLYVGSRIGYKNFNLFAKAFSVFHHKNKDIFLICTGSPFSKEENNMFKSLGIKDNIMSYSVTDSELAYLYQNALAFVYPSIYEGFGMPILEAFSCNCPVLLSNSSCFPEIAGTAGVYFDPFSIESMTSAFQLILDDIEFRTNLVNQGLKQLKQFSWKKTANETSKLYRSLY